MARRPVLLNVAASVGSQLAGIVISLLMPRLLIVSYGSEVNGFVSSVARIAAYFSVLQGGVVAAAGAHLFRAFSRGDSDAVRAIFVAAHRFFFRSGFVLALVAFVFCFVFPLEFLGSGFYGPAVGVAALSLLTVVTGHLYFFKYHLIVDSDQRSYVIVNSVIVTNLLVAAAQVGLILGGASIVAVVAVVPAAGLARLLLTRAWVRRAYPYLRLEGPADTAALDQKWDSLAIATSRLIKFVLPSVVASVLLGFEFASVFLVYAAVFSVGSSVVEMVSVTGAPTLGRIVASGDAGLIRRCYEAASLAGAAVSVGLSVCFAALFPGFLELYLGSVADVSYWAPVLMGTFILNEFAANLRLAPTLMVRAQGHLRQTRGSALVELALAGVLTPLGVWWLGLDGLMLGSVASSIYRTAVLEWYCRGRLGLGGGAPAARRLAVLMGAGMLAAALAALLPSGAGVAGWALRAAAVTALTAALLGAAVAAFDRPTGRILLGLLGPTRR